MSGVRSANPVLDYLAEIRRSVGASMTQPFAPDQDPRGLVDPPARSGSWVRIGKDVTDLVDALIPTEPYRSVAFHEGKVEPGYVLPEHFSDSGFYVEPGGSREFDRVREALQLNPELGLADSSLVDDSSAHGVVDTLLETDDAEPPHILQGPIGSGKSTHLCHSMLSILGQRDRWHAEAPPRFIYLNCNPYLDSELKTNTQGNLSLLIQTSIIGKVVPGPSPMNSSGWGDLLLQSIKDDPNVLGPASRSSGSTSWADFVLARPAEALTHSLWYLYNRVDKRRPVVIIDNIDHGSVQLWNDTLEFLEDVAGRWAIGRYLLAIRDATWLRLFGIRRKAGKPNVLRKTHVLPTVPLDDVLKKRIGVVRRVLADQRLPDPDRHRAGMAQLKALVKEELNRKITGRGILGRLDQIFDRMLQPEALVFLNKYAGGDLRKAIALVTLPFTDRSLGKSDVLQFLIEGRTEADIQVDGWPLYKFVRSVLSGGHSAVVRGNSPAGAFNLFYNPTCASPDRAVQYVCARIATLRDLAILRSHPHIHLADGAVEDLKSNCPSQDTEVRDKCFDARFSRLIEAGLVNSTTSGRTPTETFETWGWIELSPVGRYFIDELVTERDYLACMKYDGKLLTGWSGRWENPCYDNPLIWILSSNAEFLDCLVRSEREFKRLQTGSSPSGGLVESPLRAVIYRYLQDSKSPNTAQQLTRSTSKFGIASGDAVDTFRAICDALETHARNL